MTNVTIIRIILNGKKSENKQNNQYCGKMNQHKLPIPTETRNSFSSLHAEETFNNNNEITSNSRCNYSGNNTINNIIYKLMAFLTIEYLKFELPKITSVTPDQTLSLATAHIPTQ